MITPGTTLQREDEVRGREAGQSLSLQGSMLTGTWDQIYIELFKTSSY